jgi:acyl carrier protein
LLEFQGRADGQVKVRGYRIELSEIEAILNRLPQVLQVAVVAPEQGGSRQLVAYVRCQKQELATLHGQLKELLPSYMIPDRIEWLEELPLTKNGKLDRKALEMASVGRPDEVSGGRGLTGESLEQRIAEIFSEILEVRVDSEEDDFFTLGGQSLKAMRLLARLNHRLGVELGLRDIMTNTTVAALAAKVRAVTGLM